MKILSIDTASEICSVAILQDKEVIAEITIEDGNTHSVKLMPQIEQIFNQTNLTLPEIDLFAVDKGPGSFTGIRIGIATIKAFCDTMNKPSIGISSLLGLAYHISSPNYICSLIDAKHDMVYMALFDNMNGNYTLVDTYLADDIHNITKRLKEYNKKIFFVGNGSILYQDMLKSNLKENANFVEDTRFHKLNAVTIGKAAFDSYTKALETDTSLSPLYLRKSNAEREREESKNGLKH